VITADEFLMEVFGAPDELLDEHILLAKQMESWVHTPYPSRPASNWINSTRASTYFCVSTVRQPEAEPDGAIWWTRRKSDCVAAYCIVLDDVGSKAEPPPIEPSWKLESSANNFQWGYIIQPYENLDRYAAIVESVAALGFADAGAGGYNRVMRIPGSRNAKPGRDGFVSRVTDWHPERLFELDDLARDIGVDLENMHVQPSSVVKSVGGGVVIEGEVADPMLYWLEENGHVLSDSGSQWVDIRCPWHEAHTTGDDKAGYSPLGRGADGYEEFRAFNCLHEHCREKKYRAFLDWAMQHGAPFAAGNDPMPWIQARYVYVAQGKQVADMLQRPNGGVWLYELEEWSNINFRRVFLPDRDKPVLLKTAFLESPTTTRAATTSYVPGGEPVATAHGQDVVNVYIAPRHDETDAAPKLFLDHIDYLIPNDVERATFLDWLAYKVQHPARRCYAVCLVADNAFGIGRSWVGSMLERALQGHVSKASLGQLIGRGTSADRTYNDWAANCQFLIVDEAKDVSREDFYSAYETFKQRVDTSPVPFRSNPKYGRTRDDTMYFNALIFSNHVDAMMIPENDRRIAVFSNPVEQESAGYYEELMSALQPDSEEPRRLYWYLMRRDVSNFEPAKPPMTAAKIAMIEASKSPSEEILEHLKDTLDSDLVTRKALQEKVRAAARSLGHEGVADRPGGVTRKLWRDLGSLRPDAKNGARYTIDTGQTEVRAVRNRDDWLAVDVSRNTQRIIDEVKKASSLVRSIN